MKFKAGKFTNYIAPLILLVFCLTPLIWFRGRPGILINGSDTNFPLNPIVWFLRRFFVWNDVTNAGVNFASSTAGIFFHLIQVIPYFLGAGLQLTQIISLVFWFSAVVFGGYLLAKVIFPEKVIPRIVFVAFYSYNIYLFNTWENVKVANLALVALLPVFMAILLSFIKEDINFGKLILYSCLSSLAVSGAGINPAYILTVVFALFLVSLVESVYNFTPKGLKRVWQGFLIICTLIFLVNAFWILPTINHLFFSVNKITSLKDLGFTDWLGSLSENTSLTNVLRLQGAWDWYSMDEAGSPLYIPYALNYFRKLPFLVFSFLITGISLASFVVAKKKKRDFYAIFGVLLVIGIFFGAGGHEPTGSIYRFFVKHLPFFSLFRSPWYIFTPLVTISFAGLVGLFVEYLLEKKKYFIALAGSLVLIVSNFLYTYPLVTGKIFRPASADNFYIKFPEYVFDAGEWLMGLNGGRVIGYPDDEIERFKWGYNSIESILSLLTDSENLYSSLNNVESFFSLITREFYNDLKKGKVEAALSLASKLNVGFIFNKTDQISLAPELPQRIKEMKSDTLGEWVFYSVSEEYKLPKIYASSDIFFAYPFNMSNRVIDSLSSEELLLNPNDTVINYIGVLREAGGIVVETENLLEKEAEDFLLKPGTLSSRAVERDLSKVIYTFDIPEEGPYSPLLERYQLEDFGLLTSDTLRVVVDGSETEWLVKSINDSYVSFLPVNLTSGYHEATILVEDKNKAIEMVNKDLEEHALVAYSISDFDPLYYYLIGFDYKHIHGDFPSVVVEQRTARDPVKRKTENLPIFPEKIPFNFFYDPVVTKSNAVVTVKAPFLEDPLGTRIEVSDVYIKKVFSNKMIFRKEGDPGVLTKPDITFEKKSPVLYKGKVTGADGHHILVFSENYSQKWRMKIKNINGAEILVKPLHFSTNLYANAWYLGGTPSEYQFEIYYKPQTIFYIGLAISLTTIAGSLFYYFLSKGIKK